MNKKNNKVHKEKTKEKESKNSKNAFFSKFLIGAVAIVILLFIVILITTSSLKSKILFHEVLEWDVKVTDYVGFNLDSDKLHFGGVMPDAKGTRSIILEIPDDAFIYLTNENHFWVYTENENPFYATNKSLEINLYVKPPIDTKFDLYGSKLHVYILSDEPSWLEKMFLKGVALKKLDEPVKKPGAKINIVNPENSTNSSIQE